MLEKVRRVCNGTPRRSHRITVGVFATWHRETTNLVAVLSLRKVETTCFAECTNTVHSFRNDLGMWRRPTRNSAHADVAHAPFSLSSGKAQPGNEAGSFVPRYTPFCFARRRVIERHWYLAPFWSQYHFMSRLPPITARPTSCFMAHALPRCYINSYHLSLLRI